MKQILRIDYLFSASTLLLLILAILFFLIFQTGTNLERIEKSHHQSFLLADKLKENSIILTKFCRTYVLTQDPNWEEKYKRILADVNDLTTMLDERKFAINGSIKNLEITDAENAKLKAAIAGIKEQVQFEQISFKGMNGLFMDGNNEFKIKREPNPEFACQMLLTENYQTEKEKIIENILDFHKMHQIRTSKYLQKYNTERKGLMLGAIFLIVIITFLFYYSIYKFKKKLIERLRELKRSNYEKKRNERKFKELNIKLDHLVKLRTQELEYEIEEHIQLFKKFKRQNRELRKVQDKVLVSEEKYKLLSDVTFEGILIHKDGVGIDCNKSFFEMMGYSKDELIGQDLIELLIPDDYKKIVAENVEKGSKLPYEVIEKRKDGSTFPAEIEGRNIIREGRQIRVTAVRDITRRKKAEKQLRMLSQAVEQSVNAIMITDAKGKIEYVNQRFTKLTGYTSNEILNKNPRILNSGNQSKEFYSNLWKTILSGKSWQGEFQNVKKNKDFYYEMAYISPIKGQNGEITGFIGVKEDITYRKKTEQALIETEMKFQNIVHNISDSLAIVRFNGEFVFVNPTFYMTSGYSRKEIFKMNVSDLIHEDNIHTKDYYDKLLMQDGYFRQEMINRHKSGKAIYHYVKANIIKYDSEDVILCVMTDLTERRKNEHNTLKSIINAEEKERSRLAKELHDGLGPVFSTIKLYFQWLGETEESSKKNKIIEKGNHNIQEGIKTLKEISNNLNPHLLINYGLIYALEHFILKFNNLKKINFHFTEELKYKIEIEIEVTLYRVITELINNTIKYASASNIWIHLEKKAAKKSIIFKYADDGVGFCLETVKKKNLGQGIVNIESRIKNLGGNVLIKTAPQKGFSLLGNISQKGFYIN